MTESTIYWAPGEGLGHLTRAAAVVHTLGMRPVAVHGSAHAWPEWLPAPAGLTYHPLPDDPGQWRALTGALASQPLEVWLDTFPAGLHGEWAGMDLGYTLVARRLMWRRYLQRVRTDPRSPRRCLRLEPLETEQVEWLAACPTEALHLTDLFADAAPVLPAEGPHWLIMHSGPAAEVDQLAAHARQIAALSRRSPVLWLATESDYSAADLRAFSHRPVWPCLSRFDHVICAAGFNSVRQVLAAGVSHAFMPLERSLDDQFFRARWARRSAQSQGATRDQRSDHLPAPIHESLAAHAAIEGDDLALAALTAADRELFVSLYTDPRTMRFVAPPLSRRRAGSSFLAALRQWSRPGPRYLYWALRHKGGKNGIGVVALIPDPQHAGQAEVGIMLESSVLGRGLSTRGLWLLASHAFAHGLVRTLRARHQVGNRASRSMLARVGFRPTGHSRADSVANWLLDAHQLRAPGGG